MRNMGLFRVLAFLTSAAGAVKVKLTVREQRKSRRFELRLPVELVRRGALHLPMRGETRNLSSSGVLFQSDAEVEIGESIEYHITLPAAGDSQKQIRLRCMGKVLRHNDTSVAATLERYEFLRSAEAN